MNQRNAVPISGTPACYAAGRRTNIIWLMTMTLGIGVGDLGAHQDNLRGVVDPDQHHDDRGRSSVSGFKPLLSDVEADSRLTQLEEKRCQRRAEPDVAQATETSGSHLNIIAKSAITTTNEISMLTACGARSGALVGRRLPIVRRIRRRRSRI
jgi:hypothetical protein